MASGTISIPPFTKTLTITVAVTLQDADQIALSNDGTTFGAWQAATNNGTVQHTITSGDGQKTVHAKFRQSPNGAESAVVTAQTTLDTVAPTGTLLINNGAPVTASPAVTLTYTAADSSKPITVRFKNETGEYEPAETVPDTGSTTKSWSLTSQVGSKTVTMQVQDAAGNQTTVSASIWLTQASGAKWVILKTPDYDGNAANGTQTSYLRQGAANSSEESDLLDSHEGTPFSDFARSTINNVKRTFDGWFEYTDGTRTDVARGARVEITGGDKTTFVVGSQKTEVLGTRVETIGGEYRLNIGGGTLRTYNADPIFWMRFKKGARAAGASGWRQTVLTHTSTDTYSFGDVESFFGGYKFDGTFGISSSLFVGGKIDLSAAINASASLGFTFAYTKSVNLTAVDGKDLRTVGNHDLKARSSIRLRVQGPHPLGDASRAKRKKVLMALAAGSIGAIISATAGAVEGNVETHGDPTAPGGGTEQDGVGAYSPGAIAGLSLAAASFGIGLVFSVVWALQEAAGAAVPPEPLTQLKLTDTRAKLAQHNAAGVMQGAVEIHQGQVTLSNRTGAIVDIQPNGGILALAPATIVLQTLQGSSAILGNNAIDLDAGQVRINGQQVNVNNVLQVVGPPPVIVPAVALNAAVGAPPDLDLPAL